MRSSHKTRTVIGLTAGLLLALVITLPPASAVAQNDDAARREQVQAQNASPQGDVLREHIRERIENEKGLEAQERERLRQHIGECNELQLPDDVTAALFAEGAPLKNQIRIQERVLAMAREGMPIEPVTQKLQEGRRKGVNHESLERACAKMESHVRTAMRIVGQAHQDGVRAETPEAERRHTRQIAFCMWSGLEEGDMDQLRERARMRLRDGTCTTGDLAAAAETASRLHEMHVDRKRALNLAGEALQNGYSAQDMQQLRWMVTTAAMHGGPHKEVLDTLERGLRNQHQLASMMREMQRHGWMGPADEHGGHGAMGPNNTSGSGPGGAYHGGDNKGHGGNDKGQGGSGGGGEGGKGGGGKG